ncbi:hypothetical protein M0Q97_13740 [Candidatus Dojkabacteria bacterium]|jgi:hypothetical protein|nr:hypothetical protein [Candidatus Dojkabacteria bacterium]
MDDNNFNKNYESKIVKKISIDNDTAKGINDMIILLNYSFLKQNNFFVENFNKKTIPIVCKGYNQLKTNILTPTVFEIFDNLSLETLKLLRFITNNFITNYENIIQNNNDLSDLISKDALGLCSKKISEYMKQF